MYDYIIVGSGHNALICAYHLSRRYNVLVLERNAHFGGCIATDEVTVPGFRHDLAAMNLNLFAGSAFFQEAKDELQQHGFSMIHSDKPCASVFPDHQYCAVFQDLAKTLDIIASHSQKDAQTWQQLNQDFFPKVEHLLPILGEKMPSLATFKHLIKGIRKHGMAWFYDMIHLVIASPRRFATQHFENPKVQSMLASWSMHLDFAPDVAGGALFAYLESFFGQNVGIVLGKNGADSLSKSLVSLLQSRNVTFSHLSEVKEVLVENNQAVGVRTDQETIRATKGVIANCSPVHLFTRLIAPHQVSTRFLNQIKQFKPGVGTMMIHLALEKLPTWKAAAVLQTFTYIHIAPYMHDMAQCYIDCQRGFLPKQPFMVVGQPTAIDPSRAPEGKHILWIQVRAVPYTIQGDAAGEITSNDWQEIKEHYADRLVGIIDSYCSEFKQHIIARKVYSPVDIEHFNPNLIGGCNLSGSSHLTQNLFMRPVPGYSRYKMPIKGLYLLGAATWPGAGVGGGSGHILGRSLI